MVSYHKNNNGGGSLIQVHRLTNLRRVPSKRWGQHVLPSSHCSAEAIGQEVKRKVQIIIRDGGYAILIGEYVVGQQKIPKKMLESAARCSARTGSPKSLIHHKEDNS